jgi:hypothetical protein
MVGNVEKPEYLSSFDIYLRGVGPKLDEKGRFFIYRKNVTKKFPNNREIADKLIVLAMLYGSSNNMEAAQTQYLRAYSEMLKEFKDSHEYPLALSEEAEKAKEEIENANKKPVSLYLF